MGEAWQDMIANNAMTFGPDRQALAIDSRRSTKRESIVTLA